MKMDEFAPFVETYQNKISSETLSSIDHVVEYIVKQKEDGNRLMVITGSGPNLHEGVTTFIAELMHKKIVDGVSTSSAVVAHELAGALDRVHRVNGLAVGIDQALLPKGDIFEFTHLSPEELDGIQKHFPLDLNFYKEGMKTEGQDIIKAAGNMAYPMGLITERISKDILSVAKASSLPFERVAGWGADPRTMIGAAAMNDLPVLVSVPQLIGGGGVGLAIGDSLSITERCARMAKMIDDSQVLIESAIALTQEIHDGPFETFTGHGIWADWDGYSTTRLEGKGLIRIDLDPNLKIAWDLQRTDATIQTAIDKGLPKTKITGIPFRMEMSGFARIESSIPLIGDIGLIWPILGYRIAKALGVELDYISHPQDSNEGQEFREWIVSEVKPFSKEKMMQISKHYRREP
jgi:hypothetical protein